MDTSTMKLTYDKLMKSPIHSWSSEYKLALSELVDVLSDIISNDLLLRWRMNATFKGRGVLQLPDDGTSISNWLKIQFNNHPEKLNIFWRILEDQSKASENDLKIAEEVKTLISNNPIGCIFIMTPTS